MRIAPALSLDQLQVFLAVAESGGFAAAGRSLSRATSAISYTIDTLERQLGLRLFDRGSTRRPTLTPAGIAVRAEARSVLHGADVLRARVKGLLAGLEAELSLVVDQMFPSAQLARILNRFHATFPTVPLRVRTEAMNGVERAIRGGQASIGVGGVLHMERCGLTMIQIPGVPVVPVATPHHPLASVRADQPKATHNHLQIVLAESVELEKRSFGVVSGSTWRVGDLITKHALLLAGVGWGGMPEHMVRADLDAGRLTTLDLADLRTGEYGLQIAYQDDTPPGLAGQWLIEQLSEWASVEATSSTIIERGKQSKARASRAKRTTTDRRRKHRSKHRN